jgi:DNA-binding CsgD family transcriptional regulator
MTTITDIKRTANGYQLAGLEAVGLPPRESQALLLKAEGKSTKDIAKIMNCSTSNIVHRIENLFFKLRANSTPELITKAFKNNTLRFLSLLLALFIGIGAPGLTDENSKYTARAGRVRPRSRTATRAKNGELIWLPETGQLIIA